MGRNVNKYIILYTKEKGKLELTYKELLRLDVSSITYHRLNGPAQIFNYGTKKWYKDGKLHREDGPAIISQEGTTQWWKNGKLDRDDGPAIEWSSGDKEWYKNGKLHREKGPAVQYADGENLWFFNNKNIDITKLDNFNKIYKPTKNNISIYLCDKNREVRIGAEAWVNKYLKE